MPPIRLYPWGNWPDTLDHMADDQAGPEVLKSQVEQILAKLQRILRRLDAEELDEFQTLSGGETASAIHRLP